MNKWGLIGVILVISLMAIFSTGSRMQPGNTIAPAVKETADKAQVTIDKEYGKMPLAFIPNKGQMDKQVYFYLQGKDKSVYFTSIGLTYALAGPADSQPVSESKSKPGSPVEQRERESSQPSSRWVVKLDFVGAREDAIPECLEKSGTVISYFKGKAAEWQTGLQAASKIIYRDLWPGIDLVYYGTVNRIKYEFIVHPGADPAQIKLAYRGAESVMENRQGQLEVQTPLGGFSDDTPVAWQEIAGKRRNVALKYALENKNPSNPQDAYIYGFSVGEYDKNKTLILDPVVIVYCGYIGASNGDVGQKIAIDTSGCAYITGDSWTYQSTFPLAVGPDLTYNGGDNDVFVAKVNAAGTGLVYCGYIGGANSDHGQRIAVDASGCAYITGGTDSTESSFPVTVGPDLTYNGGYSDAFVAKVNASGSGLVYCGYIGGSGYYDNGFGIAVDASGYAYVSGDTNSDQTTFPVTVGPDLTHNGDYDIFVAKVGIDGTGLVYCGYIGGSQGDTSWDIAVDSSGCAYLSGGTQSTQTDFPVSIGPDLAHNGGEDAFIAKVKADGTGLVYCGYIGGSGWDFGKAITVDSSNCAYITGDTDSAETSFPVTVGPDVLHNGGSDIFVAKVNADGTALDYCGYIGGSESEGGNGIAVDASGCAYITGFTFSTETTFPLSIGPDLSYNGSGSADAFVAKINAGGTGLVYCGYIGGSAWDSGNGIAVDASGSAYITGHTGSSAADFPVTVGPDLTYNGGTFDAFVVKISWADPTVNFTAGTGGSLTGETTQTVAQGGNCTAVEAVPNNGYSFVNWTGDGGFVTTTDNPLTVTNVTANMTITANFTIDTYTVTFVPDSDGTLTGVTPQTVDYGTNCTAVEAVPNTGYHFVDWTGTGGFVTTTDNPLTVSNVTADMTITANFTIDTYTVTFVPGSHGTLTGVTPQTVDYGTNCTAVEAVPDPGYHFVNWTGTNGFATTTANPLTVANVTGDMTVTANFAFDSPLPIQLGAWSTTTPFNTPRYAHTSVAYNGYLYVMGGCDESDTTRYNDVQYAPINADGSLGSWQNTTPFNTGRRSHASVVYNGYLYVMGGTPSGGGILNDVQFAPINADGSLGSWQYTTPFNTGRLVFSSVVYNGYLYVIQGFQYSAAFPLTDVQVVAIDADGTLGSWQNTTSFAPGRWGHQSIAYNQYLYTMGGGNWNGSYYTLGDAQYSSIDAGGTLNAWQGTTALDPYRDAFGLVQYGGNLIMTGGINNSAYYHYVQYAATHADGTLGPWLRMTSFNKARASHTSVVYNGYLYVIGGGANTGTAFADVQYAKINELIQPTHAVTFVESTNGTISGSLYQVITAGEDCAQVTAVPGTGCVFGNWTGDGGFATTTDNPLTVTNVTTDMTITANFLFIDITGRVTDSGNNGIANVNVTIFNLDYNQVTSQATDSNGDYTIYGLAAGDYKAWFDTLNSDGNLAREWYSDRQSFDIADTITVTDGNTTGGIDAQLEDGGDISGKVMNASLVGIENVTVCLYDTDSNWINNASTDANGDYIFQRLLPGNYKIIFDASETSGYYVREWYNNQNDFAGANAVTVTAGVTTPNINAVLADGGTIGGTVTNSENNGIANVNVNIYDTNYNFVLGAATDANGYYMANGLAPGNYKAEFNAANAGNYLDEWHNNQGSFDDADPVSVIAGNVTGLDAQLTAGGILSGQVTNSSLNGINNVQVIIYDVNFNQVNDAWTDGNGNYSILKLYAGDYKIFFNAGSAGNYLDEWNNDKNSFDNADVVAITAGNTTSINPVLTEGGTITGRVTDAANNGIEGVNVQVCDLVQYWLYGTNTDSNGDYTITRVKTGSFKVEFRPDGLPGNYVREWYDNQVSFNSANVVEVTAGNTTANINAQLANAGSISGRVTDTGNNGIANVDIIVYDTNGNQIAWSGTDGNGDYTIGSIPSGNQKVQFWPGNAGNYMPEWYDDQATFEQAETLLVVAGETTTGIDAQLADSGAVSGRVTNATGTIGLANIEVQICDLNGSWYPGTNTDNDGYYTLRGLPAGTYKIDFRTHWVPGNYVREWYNDQNSFENATPVTVTVGQTTGNIDAALADGGAIGGRVTDATGTLGLANVDVTICDMNGNGLTGLSTDGEGYYTVHGLPAGDYKIQFTTHNVNGSYVAEWYNDKDSSQNADALTVTVGQTTAGIDAQLADGGTIGGRVTNSANNGVANVNVHVYDTAGNWLEWANTDSSGYYTVKGVPAGDHRVQFWTGNAGNYLEEWYNDKNSQSEADPVTVTAGNTTGNINAQLATGGIITGKVMDSSLIGIPNVTVCVHDTNGNWLNNYTTDSDGDYTVDRLPTGSYKIYFESRAAGNYIREWYNDQDYFENANPVAVTAGNTTKNINAVLADGGVVGGRVTDSGNNGIADVYVGICDMNRYWHQVTRTDSDGNYTLIGLPAGDYKIQFQTNWTPGNFVGEWYDDQNSFENATPVTVIVNQTTTGIDAALGSGGGVSGRVTDSSGTVGIPNVNINICDMNQNWLDGVSTDNNGYYTLYGVPAGGYKIQFYAQHLGNYANEWWNNQRRFETANEVTVSTGNTTENIDAQLEIVGSISGTVTDAATSAPIENVLVYVYDLAHNEMGNCWTASDGNYSVNNLDPAGYKVYFNTTDAPLYIEEWYDDKNSFEEAGEVTVNGNASTTVDAGLAAIQDDAYEPNDDFEHAAEITAGTYNDLVYLSPDGDYQGDQDWYKIYVGQDQAGKNLKVNLRVTSPYPENPPGGWASDLDFDILDGTGQTLAKALSSSDNETLYIANLAEGWYYIALQYCTVNYGPEGTGVHADYSMTVAVDTAANLGIGLISGRVTNEQDQGIGGSPVLMMHDPYDWAVSFPIISTDANGYYTIGYTPGDFTLQFNYNSPTLEPLAPNYVSEYYNDKTSLEEAQVFSLHAGSSITGIDAVLMAGARIEGTLTHSTGNPVVLGNQGIAYAFDKNTKISVSLDYNDATGNYSIKYLPPGTYKILFRARDENWTWYAREWYDNQPSLGTGVDMVISTAGEVITGINNQFSASAVIQGRVTNGAGDGIGNVRVNIYSVLDPDNIMRSAYTNGNGDYTILEIFPGDVKIYIDADEQNTPYVSEWYDNTGSFNEAGTVTLTEGQTTSGIDAQLSDKGIISGRVTDASGTTGLANISIGIHDLTGNGISGTGTDENGYYTVSGIPAGEYKLYFNPGGVPGNYLGEWYNDKNSFENADAVTVDNGQTTGGIDAQLTEGGAVSGRVTDTSGTLGIAGVDVTVYDAAYNWIGGCSTDSNGDYIVNCLPAGNYKLEFTTNNAAGDYVGEWYNDKSSFEAADTVTVTPGQTTGGVGAQLADGGAINGRVTDASGTVGIANVEVQICDLNQYWYPGTNTDSDGYYTLRGLEPGNYKIMFNTRYTPGNYVYEWYNDKYTFESGDTVAVTAGQTTAGIDAQLANGGGISGRITDVTGTVGISNAWVAVYDLNNTNMNSVGAAGDGYYTIYGLPAGTYKVQFNLHQPSGYVGEWYDDKISFENADAVVVNAGLITGGIDAQLANGGGIAGRVTDSSGTVGIANVSVQIWDLNNLWYLDTNTDSDGYYNTQNGLPSGNYKIEFETNLTTGDYIAEWYNDQNSYENANPITVTVGQITAGIDAQLADGGSIAGRVTDSSGTVGIANVSVQIRDINNNWYPGTNTGSDGYYTLHGLAAGDYKIQFQTAWAPGNYVGEWYNDKSTFETADTVTVTVSQTIAGIDAQLADGGAVSGRVTDASGTIGISHVGVQIYDLNHSCYSSTGTDPGGYYTLRGLPAGDYKIQFWANNTGNYLSEWYNDKSSFEVADTITVTVGQTTAGIDAQLAEGGSISGRVIDAADSGIQNIDVQVYDLDYLWINSVRTGSNGDYTLSHLPPGSVKVYFETNQAGNYVTEWYNDKGSFDTADAVTITAGQTQANIDAQLTDGGIISGRVSNEADEGIEGVRVRILYPDGNFVTQATTGAEGNYTVQRLAPGSYKIDFYTLNANGSYLREWYDNKSSVSAADLVEVTAGQTTTANAVLAAAGTVTGRVTNDEDTGIQGVRVQLRDLANINRFSANTNSTGDYTIKGITPGLYKVFFNSYSASGSYIPEYYNDKTYFKDSDTISVTAGQTIPGIDAVLAPGCTISGTVTDEAANPLELIDVYILGPDGTGYGGTYTDGSGQYQLKGLVPGTYKVWFYPYERNYWGVENGYPSYTNYRIEWYNDKDNFLAGDAVATSLESPATGIDAVLTENGGGISGRITDSLGNGIANCSIALFQSEFDADWYDSGYSDADGNYVVKGLAPGNWKLLVLTPGGTYYRREFYNNTPDIYNAAPVPVTAGETATGIDFVLDNGGLVTGRVTDSSGNGIPNVLARLVDPTTNRYLGWLGNGGRTDWNGYYSATAQAGQWKVLFQTCDPPVNTYLSEFYDDQSVVENAAIITVDPEQTVSGIDAILAIGGGKISGYVKDTGNTGLGNAEINVYDSQYQNPVGYAFADANGYFEMAGLIPGTYKLHASYNNYLPSEWYSDKTTYETGNTLTVTGGGNTPVTIILGGANSNLPDISGQVRNYAGTGLENVDVNLYDLNQEFIVSVTTDANGEYAFYNIPAGDYKLYSDAGAVGNYVSEWYQNTLSFDEAETLTVTAEVPLEHIDVGLTAGGIIAGHITNESGQGIQGVRVVIRDRQNTWIAAVDTDAVGNYSISRLVPDSYKVFFRTDNAVGLYVKEWYNDKENFNTADFVVVPAGETITVDVTLAAGGAVSGTVTNGTDPIENMEVDIYSLDSSYITSAYTDSSGNYLVKGVPVGTYKVIFNPWELNYHGVDWYGLPRNYNYQYQWYNQKNSFAEADEVSVTVGNTAAGIDAVMNENESGIISGRITDSSGSGIAGCYVYTFESFDNQMDWYYSEYYAGTGPDGNYEIKGLPTGNYIVLFFSWDSLYKNEFYDNKRDRDLADRVAVTAGQTVPGIDAELEKGGIVTGRVTDSTGNGLQNVLIRFMDAATNKYLGFIGNNAQTDENGEYEVTVNPGQWKVMFQAYSMEVGGYVSEFYNNKAIVENANIVTVAAEEPTPNIDAVLSYGGGKISGYVKDPANTVLSNAQVYVFDTQYKIFVGQAAADSSGYFEVAGLIPGNYKVYTFYYDVYPSEWYSDETAYETAKSLTVTTGGNTYIEVVLGGDDPVNPGQILITSPNGGEILTGGTIHPITWDTFGSNPGQPVIIEYSPDNGTNWLMINPEAADTGSYSWTVPAVSSGTCRVKISSGDGDAVLSAVSDECFEIVSALPPSIKLLSPKRWLEITAGTVQTVTWTSTGNAGQVVLEYSTDSGITWSTIAAAAPNTGSYRWAVPDTPSQHCHLRIRLGDGDSESAPFDMTDIEFSIVTTTTPGLTITSPNGGEAWRVGTAQTITWAKTGNVPNVKIEYTINNGSTWQVIIASTANTGSYPWTIPNNPSGECKVRVGDIDGNPTDMSDAVFSIEPLPTITLTSPNGGETWQAGTIRDIAWTWAGTGGDVKIEYSVDGGTTWGVVTSSANASGIYGTYSWTVPDTPAESCLVRVGRNDTEEGPMDVSDGVFTIEAASLLSLDAPNGGEQWKAGDTYRIAWTAANLEGNVMIDLYRGDDFDFNIGAVSVNDGRLEWQIPGNFKNADDYRVVIHKDQAEDASDTAFSITERKPNHPDFDNDGKVDILWLNPATGKNEVWYMDGCRRKAVGNLPSGPGLDFQLVGTGDFNRDGKVDILWRHSKNGQNLVWYMDGIRQQGADVLPVQPDINWRVVGTGDFNGDGKVDILWRHALKGLGQVWLMDGVTVTGNMAVPPRENPGWLAVATGDFNDDEKVDILWRSVKDGRNEVWFMDGVIRTGTMAVQEQTRLQWQIVGTGDFNCDGHPDILWRRSSDGKHLVWYMDGVVRIGYEYINISQGTSGSDASDLN